MTNAQASLRAIVLSALTIAWLTPSAASAAPLYTGFGGPAGFGTGILNGNDDGSTPPIDLTGAFSGGLRFYGGPYTQFWVNNNGNISFGNAIYTFTPNPFPIANQPMIAPYWADVDTRNRDGLASTAENLVYYHLEPGRLVVTWYNVGYYSQHNEHRMSFQLILTNATDCGSGDFDVEFRYDRCEWVSGGASGDTNGNGQCDAAETGCTAAQAGFDAGNNHDFTALPNSFTNNIVDICTTSNLDAAHPGDWEFSVRAGGVVCREDMPCTVDGAVGACSIGRTQCEANVAVCRAITMPTSELCDAVDNDCNGTPDDQPGLCGPSLSCVLGACVSSCFEGSCATGFTCNTTIGVCVETACVGVTCAADQRCEGGTCVSACEGIVCPHGEQCISGVCVDPCAAIACDTDRICQGGICVLRCPCSPCPVGQTCLADGTCQPRGCDIVTCDPGQYCDQATCHDSCENVMCPRGQVCSVGHCVLPGIIDAGMPDGGMTDAGMDAGMIRVPDAYVAPDASHGPPIPGEASRNCGCHVSGSQDRPWGAMLLAAGVALVLARRRTRR